MKETVETRAVKIAAIVMQRACLCRYDNIAKCRRVYVDELICRECIKKWLLSEARKELKQEGSL